MKKSAQTEETEELVKIMQTTIRTIMRETGELQWHGNGYLV